MPGLGLFALQCAGVYHAMRREADAPVVVLQMADANVPSSLIDDERPLSLEEASAVLGQYILEPYGVLRVAGKDACLPAAEDHAEADMLSPPAFGYAAQLLGHFLKGTL